MFIEKNGKVIINEDGSVEIKGFSFNMEGEGSMDDAQKMAGEWAIKQIQASIAGAVTINKRSNKEQEE